MKTALAWLLMSAMALAQNTLDIPDEVAVGEKIVAFCKCVTPDDGGHLSILWDHSPELETEQIDDRLFVWGKARAESYRIGAVVIPLRTLTIQDQTFDVIAGPITRLTATFKITGSIEPDPDPDPDPKPNAPFPSDGFAVIVLKEASETGTLTPAQRSILTSSKVLKYINSKAVKVGDGVFFRAWDDDYTEAQLSAVAPELALAYRESKKLADGRLPWICISTGDGGYSGPLPATLDEMMTLLQKYGG